MCAVDGKAVQIDRKLLAAATSTMVLLILTPDEMLEKGLRYANLHNSNVSRRKKIERFGSWFGSSPAVLAQI